MTLLGCLLLTAALAQETALPPEDDELAGERDWKSQPYWQPIVTLNPMRSGNQLFLQGNVGAEVGLRYLNTELHPKLLGRSRLRGVYSYGLGTGSWGVDARLGSFMGPKLGMLTLQHGPDAWFNFYGAPGALDYHLPPTAGVSVSNQAVLQPLDELAFIASANPGWVFSADRKTPGPPDTPALPVFDELDLVAALAIMIPGVNLVVGYRRSINSFGVQDGLILSGGL